MPLRRKTHGRSFGFRKRRVYPKSYRRSRRKSGLPRKKNTRINKTIIKGPSLASDKMYVKLKYVEWFQLNTVSGIQNYFTINAVDPYDPQYATGGVSALGYSFYTQMYNKELCLGSSIRATLYPITSNNNPKGTYVDFQLEYSTSPTPASGSRQNVAVQPLTKSRIVDIYSSTGDKGRTIRQFCSNGKAYGVSSKQVYNDISDWGHAVNALSSTNHNSYYVITANPLDDVSTTDTICKVEVTYYMMFYQRVIRIYT